MDTTRIDMCTNQSIYALALLAGVFLSGCLAYPSIRQHHELIPSCEGCGDQCTQCRYGFTYSEYCGIYECLKGPGHSCGGPSNVNGVCGDGMSCICEKCSGCSTRTLECYLNDCLPYQSVMGSRHFDKYERFPFVRTD